MKLSVLNLHNALNDEISNMCDFSNPLNLHLKFEDDLFEQMYANLTQPILNEFRKTDVN